jgi:hypothetical protein
LPYHHHGGRAALPLADEAFHSLMLYFVVTLELTNL